jgi:hypothetical protein
MLQIGTLITHRAQLLSGVGIGGLFNQVKSQSFLMRFNPLQNRSPRGNVENGLLRLNPNVDTVEKPRIQEERNYD